MILNRDGIMKRPDRQDLHLLEAVLWAIPPFLAEHLKPDQQGDYHPVQGFIPIVTLYSAHNLLPVCVFSMLKDDYVSFSSRIKETRR